MGPVNRAECSARMTLIFVCKFMVFFPVPWAFTFRVIPTGTLIATGSLAWDSGPQMQIHQDSCGETLGSNQGQITSLTFLQRLRMP